VVSICVPRVDGRESQKLKGSVAKQLIARAKNHLPKLDFVIQSIGMESNWAAEHLQTIRTLMERSALYRRALAPIMTYNGAVGTVAAIAGWSCKIDSPRGFILFWACVAGVALAGSFLLVRRQALKAGEAFWSPPTRRITQAMLPALAAGLIIGAIVYSNAMEPALLIKAAMFWLPLGWVVMYGCAFHAAGFFMPRGMRIFGWAFVIAGCALSAVTIRAGWEPSVGYAIMGIFFGVLHLAYGVYLYFTEQRRDET
jgi:hypothetical protein